MQSNSPFESPGARPHQTSHPVTSGQVRHRLTTDARAQAGTRISLYTVGPVDEQWNKISPKGP
jgi:hypothetical protein